MSLADKKNKSDLSEANAVQTVINAMLTLNSPSVLRELPDDDICEAFYAAQKQIDLKTFSLHRWIVIGPQVIAYCRDLPEASDIARKVGDLGDQVQGHTMILKSLGAETQGLHRRLDALSVKLKDETNMTAEAHEVLVERVNAMSELGQKYHRLLAENLQLHQTSQDQQATLELLLDEVAKGSLALAELQEWAAAMGTLMNLPKPKPVKVARTASAAKIPLVIVGLTNTEQTAVCNRYGDAFDFSLTQHKTPIDQIRGQVKAKTVIVNEGRVTKEIKDVARKEAARCLVVQGNQGMSTLYKHLEALLDEVVA